MGLFDWMARSAGRDLDRRVAGVEGTAHATFAPPSDEGPVVALATIQNGHGGTVSLRWAGDRRDGGSALVSELGPARDLRGIDLRFEATVTRAAQAAPAALAVLAVELRQPDPAGGDRPPLAFESFSVESRFDAAGSARLSLIVRCA